MNGEGEMRIPIPPIREHAPLTPSFLNLSWGQSMCGGGEGKDKHLLGEEGERGADR